MEHHYWETRPRLLILPKQFQVWTEYSNMSLRGHVHSNHRSSYPAGHISKGNGVTTLKTSTSSVYCTVTRTDKWKHPWCPSTYTQTARAQHTRIVQEIMSLMFVYGIHLGTEDHYVSGVSQVQKDKYTHKSKERKLNIEVVDSSYQVCWAGSW